MVDFNIDKLTTLWNKDGSGKVNSEGTEKSGSNSVWDRYNLEDTKSVEFSETQMEEIYEKGKAYASKVRNEGTAKYAEIEKARTEATSNGVSYDEAVTILDSIPDANFGVVRDEKTGKLRHPTVDEIYEFCKNNPENPQAAVTIERIDKARQAISEFEAKYPDVTTNEYNNYRLISLGNMNFGV